jgi:hypothetical protein
MTLSTIKSGDVILYSRTNCDGVDVVSFLPVVRATRTTFVLPNGQRFNKHTGALVGAPFNTSIYVRAASASEAAEFRAGVAAATALLDEQAASEVAA